jgi:predicted GIY-YIG superfamily endonuclease
MAEELPPAGTPCVYTLKGWDPYAGPTFYVGSTEDMARRLQEHASGEVRTTRRLFGRTGFSVFGRPTRCTTRKEALQLEVQLTIDLMAAYGIDRVEGGCYIAKSGKRSPAELEAAVRAVDHVHGRCYACHAVHARTRECGAGIHYPVPPRDLIPTKLPDEVLASQEQMRLYYSEERCQRWEERGETFLHHLRANTAFLTQTLSHRRRRLPNGKDGAYFGAMAHLANWLACLSDDFLDEHAQHPDTREGVRAIRSKRLVYEGWSPAARA